MPETNEQTWAERCPLCNQTERHLYETIDFEAECGGSPEMLDHAAWEHNF